MSSLSFNQGLLKIKENGTEYFEIKSKSTPVAMVAPELKRNKFNSEISKTCAVSGCEDYKIHGPESFFRFPEDPNMRQIWADLTGRHDWTPTDYSYICIQHFSSDSFIHDEDGELALSNKAVPSIKLPGHVLEGEYIDEETLETDGLDEEMDTDHMRSDEEDDYETYRTESKEAAPKKDNAEILKLFTEVQKMQRQVVCLKDKLKCNMKLYNQQSKYLQRLNDEIETKKKVINMKKKKKSRILLSIQDKIRDDTTGLVLAMPVRHTEDMKNFALNVYKYSPQAYIYARNTLRTMLPSTDILESWIKAGFQPTNVMSNSNLVKVIAEQTETELSCKVTIQ